MYTHVVGLDLSTHASSLAAWDPSRNAHRMLPAPSGELSVPLRIGFRRQFEKVGELIDATYPLSDDWVEVLSSAVIFNRLEMHLPAFGDSEVVGFVSGPILDYWRRAIPTGEARVSIAVPFTYPLKTCEALRGAALQAGFQFAAFISRFLAAILAYLPVLQQDDLRWRLLETGRYVWVVDSGILDIDLALIRVRRRSAETDRIDFFYLAGDRLENCGSQFGMAEGQTLTDQVRQSVTNMTRAVLRGVGSQVPDSAGDIVRASWIVCAGDGPNLQPVTEHLRNAMSQPGAVVPELYDRIPPSEVVAAGAAVHSAMHASGLRYQIGLIELRPILGLRAKLPGNQHFLSLTGPSDEPPIEFERAFRIPFGVGSRPVEITLGAALPGGDLFGGVETLLLRSEEFRASESAILLVKGEMSTWASGRMSLWDAGCGRKLRDMEFRLP